MIKVILFCNFIIETMTQSKFKSKLYNKISRRRVPNLIYLVENSSKTNAALPKFFNKIQNTFKLLEDPLEFNNHNQSTEEQTKNSKNSFSLRLNQLAKHKQRFTTVEHNQTLYCPKNHIQSDPSNSRPISLPRMHNIQRSSQKSKSLKGRQTTSSLSPYGKINKNKIEYSDFQKQQIATSNINIKSYEQIVKQLEQQQEKKKRQNQKILGDEESEYEWQNQYEGMNNSIQKQKNETQVTNPASQNLTELSQRLVGSQPKLYDDYDKRLMQKIKVYRTKRYKFNLQAVWKH